MQPPFATSFQFRVTFDLSPDVADTRFQSVSGLQVSYETFAVKEGGENRFVHQLPERTSYQDVVLKRAIVTDSAVVEWCREAFENFRFQPVTVTIQLLNPRSEPLRSWHLDRAWPKQWELGELNAENNGLVIESLTLSYRRFHAN